MTIKDHAGSAERGESRVVPGVIPGVGATAADAKASGAADRMWQQVERDLERLDRLEATDSDDE